MKRHLHCLLYKMDSVLKLIGSIEYCLLPKLGRNFDESDFHVEYNIRFKKLDQHFDTVVQVLGDLKEELKENVELAPSVLSSLFIMYKELQSDGPWNTEKSKEYSKKLNDHFEFLYGITFDKLLQKNNCFDHQDVFDKCVENLHRKLTAEDFKKYPGRIEVYCSLVQNIKEYNVILNPLKILPISLLLIEDFNISTFKIKGLKCCKYILQNMTYKEFENGNYYDVIHASLVKAFTVKDTELTKLLCKCFMELLRILQKDKKVNVTSDLFSNVLQQIYVESNLYRKAVCLNFTKSIIVMHGINCAKKKKLFISVICDNLDTCTNTAVSEILLLVILECLEEWIKHCWCILKFSTDKKLLSVLIKLLYIHIKDENLASKIQNLIVVLIKLCTKEEQKEILNNLGNSSEISNEEFLQRLEVIKRCISI